MPLRELASNFDLNTSWKVPENWQRATWSGYHSEYWEAGRGLVVGIEAPDDREFKDTYEPRFEVSRYSEYGHLDRVSLIKTNNWQEVLANTQGHTLLTPGPWAISPCSDDCDELISVASPRGEYHPLVLFSPWATNADVAAISSVPVLIHLARCLADGDFAGSQSLELRDLARRAVIHLNAIGSTDGLARCDT